MVPDVVEMILRFTLRRFDGHIEMAAVGAPAEFPRRAWKIPFRPVAPALGKRASAYRERRECRRRFPQSRNSIWGRGPAFRKRAWPSLDSFHPPADAAPFPKPAWFPHRAKPP